MIEQDLLRARQAESLLNNDLLKEILAEMKQAYVKQWLDSSPGDTETRERLYFASQVVDDVLKELRIALENGKVTQAILDKKIKRDSSSL